MIKFSYVLLLIVLIVSCASRNSSNRNLSASSVSGVDWNVNKTVNAGVSQIDWSKVFDMQDLDISIREYDTTAKPDSAGNYPLKREENIKQRRETENERQVSTDKSLQGNIENNYTAGNQTNIDESENKDSDISAGSLFNLNWLWLLIIPAGIFLFIHRSKILKFILKK
ncbi:MAG: hypothetical protein LBQ74_15265 [Prevotella sp.]|jgi:hypothetical protein|nr:hypothetical protein [Prevotella sp.]